MNESQEAECAYLLWQADKMLMQAEQLARTEGGNAARLARAVRDARKAVLTARLEGESRTVRYVLPNVYFRGPCEMTFVEWLFAYKGSDKCIADLSYDAKRDPDVKQEWSADQLLSHIKRKFGCQEAVDTLGDALKEFMRSPRGVAATTP